MSAKTKKNHFIKVFWNFRVINSIMQAFLNHTKWISEFDLLIGQHVAQRSKGLSIQSSLVTLTLYQIVNAYKWIKIFILIYTEITQSWFIYRQLKVYVMTIKHLHSKDIYFFFWLGSSTPLRVQFKIHLSKNLAVLQSLQWKLPTHL